LRNVGIFIREKVWLENSLSLRLKMEQTECSKMSAYKLQTPGNYPEESIPQVEALQEWGAERGICTGWWGSDRRLEKTA
jgi:hypothetical protein